MNDSAPAAVAIADPAAEPEGTVQQAAEVVPTPSTTVATINGTTLDLPDSADPRKWTAEHRALMEFSGLAWRVLDPDAPREEGKPVTATKILYAPAGVAQAFIAAVKRSGLDPFARQIYVAEVGGKWTILGAIDGFRAIAEASREYEGRTPIEYTANGTDWTEVWLADEHPAAARVGIYRKGFRTAAYTTITWKEFGKTINTWKEKPVWMLGIRVLSHAYRDAFPQRLSGIYTPEDFEGAEDNQADVKALVSQIEKIDDAATLKEFYNEHEADLPDTVRAAIMARGGILEARERARAAAEAPPEPPAAPARARAATTKQPTAQAGAQRPADGPPKTIAPPNETPAERDAREVAEYEAWSADEFARQNSQDEAGA